MPAAHHSRPPTGRGGHPALEEKHLARAKKKSRQQGRTIVFLDESGLSQKPHRVRTWAPKGQTPVLEFDFTWKNLSVIAGLTLWRFYFRLHPGPIKSAQVIEFLQHLQRHVRGRLLVIWDGAMIHRSRAVRDYLDGLKGKIWAETLPAYAPELNPAEYIWGHLKQHELPNLCAQDVSQLGWHGRAALRRMRRRPKLITAFWKQAELF
ncbi:MAG: IS630 family transposase [Acidobacteriota bacterium]